MSIGFDGPDLRVNPIFEGIDLEANAQRELVFLFGYISEVTDEAIRFHQGLKLGSYLKIPRAGIVHAERDVRDEIASLTKLAVFADTKILRVNGSQQPMEVEAGALSDAIDATNRARLTAALPDDYPICPPTCERRNGSCICPMLPMLDHDH